MPKSNIEVLFFPDGNTAVFKDDKQVPELQQSWLLLFVTYLKRKGINPTKVSFIGPSGGIIEVFEVSDGDYNWRIT